MTAAADQGEDGENVRVIVREVIVYVQKPRHRPYTEKQRLASWRYRQTDKGKEANRRCKNACLARKKAAAQAAAEGGLGEGRDAEEA